MRTHIMPVLFAFILTALVGFMMFELDIPRKWMLHGMECTGEIGGGCEKL